MPRKPDDDDDNDFDPSDYGWTEQEWDELKDLYGVDTDSELLDMVPELVDYVDFIDELDYIDDVADYDDDDFYSIK